MVIIMKTNIYICVTLRKYIQGKEVGMEKQSTLSYFREHINRIRLLGQTTRKFNIRPYLLANPYILITKRSFHYLFFVTCIVKWPRLRILGLVN